MRKSDQLRRGSERERPESLAHFRRVFPEIANRKRQPRRSPQADKPGKDPLIGLEG